MGGEVLTNSLKVMRSGGALVCLPMSQFSDEIQQTAKEKNLSVSSIMVKSSGKEMHTLKTMLENNTLKPTIYKTFRFEEMQAAHAEIELGRTVGKVIVNV